MAIIASMIKSPAQIEAEHEANLIRTANIKAMALMGYTMIPAEYNDKECHYKWSLVSRKGYNYDIVFQDQPLGCNAATLCEDLVSVADFDCHEAAPNGVTVFYWILKNHPEWFAGCIIERTVSGGFHVYYRGIRGIQGAGYSVFFKVGNKKIGVEILCGRQICFCWPTVKNNQGYEILSKRNFLNTKPSELPQLPVVFAKPKTPKIKKFSIKKATGVKPLTEEELQLAVFYYTNIHQYLAEERHNIVRMLARYLAGIGVPEHVISKVCKNYIESHGRELTDEHEADRLAARGIKMPVYMTADCEGYILAHVQKVV